MSEAKWLRKAAEEIRAENHAGWGNTCEQAAEYIERLEAELERLREVAKDVVTARDNLGKGSPSTNGFVVLVHADQVAHKKLAELLDKESKSE